MSEGEVLPLVELGLYKEAAAPIDDLATRPRSPRILRASLKEHVGSRLRAEAIAESLLPDPLPPLDKAKCYEVIGRVATIIGVTQRYQGDANGIRPRRRHANVARAAAELHAIDLMAPSRIAVMRAAIECVMRDANGNNDDAAPTLGLSRKGLYLKLRRLGLK